ncbi:DUF1465 family protein [Sphingomonas carotinifaciens]|uniref:DUF1465 family protein n=1 Tax=Sphingomonas carotinifaciens TaxID=1166323 RepID=A0A1G7I8D9_9SPHN|nr:DUF1465 family protein [Sphingomonas carotinifaciens]MBB4084968.1 regulator of CtrA degradation [Sphingomonas carotinifaciens]MWC44350.1 DUF1465 family protein [Sphingomonas carotinifaciens]SDF08863.1 regulator of CtrA degradation [Sphingomonas carotinifaciens]
MDGRTDPDLRRRLTEGLYSEAMLLADEARSYFDLGGRGDRDGLAPVQRVAFSCEALKLTTRLMHVIAWLLTQRAVDAGELSAADACAPTRRLGDAPVTDGDMLATMPPRARGLVATSIDLHRRVARLDRTVADDMPNPAHLLHDRLVAAF